MNIQQFTSVFLIVGIAMIMASCTSEEKDYRELPVETYVSKMKAGWIGQMAGVGWGAPTEFQYNGEIIPESEMPEWNPEMVNQFNQDDIYVEMTFLQSLEKYGMDVSMEQAGIDFANSGYPLWHANRASRNNLRSGIAPPDAGHPEHNKHADDIDYQIEADYAGLIAPGMPNVAIGLGEKFGRLMNYGDGMYGGQFVAGMYSEAFFEKDMEKVVRAGLECIPEGSQYAECIRDVLEWYEEYPDDWTQTWQEVEEKYNDNPEYRKFSCSGPESDFNIDAKINGAYIVMGLLYGNGDPDSTIVISTRCGQDSDCNPSNAAGILFTSIGFENLPEKYTKALNEKNTFSHTPYTFPKLISVCEDLVRESLKRNGGKVQQNENGDSVFVIPRQTPEPGKLVQSWEPEPPASSLYAEEQMEQIEAYPRNAHKKELAYLAPGWEIINMGKNIAPEPGYQSVAGGKPDVFVSHPMNRETACELKKRFDIPEGKSPLLYLNVGRQSGGAWELVIKVNGEPELSKVINEKNTNEEGWTDVVLDMKVYAGQQVSLSLNHQYYDRDKAAAFWKEIRVEGL
ncbi:MAG: ADP-ribosylglycohydrolase family protein [Bacteroidales bacterium]|nr:ADP-ribosylglycohydrolase family protein [Bacteroidales bacterium]